MQQIRLNRSQDIIARRNRVIRESLRTKDASVSPVRRVLIYR